MSGSHQPSIVLGLVAAKLAVAELQGSRTFPSANDAFEAMRQRFNEMIADAQQKVPHR